MDFIGPFQILDVLGQGGMAKVYRAVQPSVNRIVALKVLAARYEQDEVYLRRFRQEAETAAKLMHDNIVRIWEASVLEPPYYIAMEYLPGGTLAERLLAGPLPLNEALSITHQLCSALQLAHEMGVVHRDIKPENVLFDAARKPVLTDFGIARAAEFTWLTTDGTKLGTPDYMSPEQAKGLKVDHRTDLYALAIVLYEMLTGRPPFASEEPLATMRKIIDEQVPRPRRFTPHISPALEKVILRMLAKNPDERYQSGAEMSLALWTANPATAVSLEKAPVRPKKITAPKPSIPASAPVSVPAKTVKEAREPRPRRGRALLKIAAVVTIVACLLIGSYLVFDAFNRNRMTGGEQRTDNSPTVGTSKTTYIVSGYVKDSNKNAIPDAVINFNHGQFRSVTTGPRGDWRQTGLTGDVQVTVSKPGFKFADGTMPIKKAVSSVTFIGEDMRYSLSGQVRFEDGTVIKDATITFKGEGRFPDARSGPDGNWQTDKVLYGRLTVKVGKSGLSFVKDSMVVSDHSDGITFISPPKTPTPNPVTEVLYSASGYVKDNENNPVANAVIHFNNGQFKTTTTGSGGKWRKDGLKGEVTVTAKLSGFTFAKNSQVISGKGPNANFIGTDNRYSLSGSVHFEDGTVIPDAEISFIGDGSFPKVYSGTNGNWETKKVLYGTVTVIVKRKGCEFNEDRKVVASLTAGEWIDFVDERPAYSVAGCVFKIEDSPQAGEDRFHNSPLAGAEIVTDSDLFGKAVTDNRGNWKIEGLHGPVRLRARASNAMFLPEYIDVTQENLVVVFILDEQ